MTTEQCSVDSLLPKSRTETFARQLQNRLRTLNSEIERDGSEETSWNCDQLSSSSEDIYYDLDSYPGSPAEEATENNFTDYINTKTSENGYSTASTNKFLIRHENSTNSYQNINSTQCSCSNKPERDLMFYGYCSNGNFDDNITSTTNERLNNVSYQNGLPQALPSSENHLYNSSTSEEVVDVTKFSNLSQIKGDLHIESSNSLNTVKERLQLNGGINTGQDHISNECEPENFLGTQELRNPEDCCTCCSGSHKESRPVDVNFNSTSKNSLDNSPNDGDLVDSGSTTDLQSDMRSSCTTTWNGQQEKTNKYTEEDLSRLVDAVFLKSQENGFDTDLCRTIPGSEDVNESSKEEEETIESKRSKFRRSSSLKTGKTPPGTPAHKKIVRFADVLGLDLADVRTFLDEVPKVPKSAFTDLKNVELSSSPPVNVLDSFMGQMTTVSLTNARAQRTIVPLFQQPSSRLEFLDRIREYAVCLENAVITDAALSVITGYVRVKNLDFHKSVHIRYSIDGWKSFADLQAKYVPNSCDGFSDKFTFLLYAHMLNVGQRLEFAIRYHTAGCTFWDNNLGANYTFQCIPDGPSKVLPTESFVSTRAMENWAAFY